MFLLLPGDSMKNIKRQTGFRLQTDIFGQYETSLHVPFGQQWFWPSDSPMDTIFSIFSNGGIKNAELVKGESDLPFLRRSSGFICGFLDESALQFWKNFDHF